MEQSLLSPALVISFLSCEKEKLNTVKQETATAEVIGIWKLYRHENRKSVINQWTEIKWTTNDEWFQNTKQDSEISIEFKENGTFRELNFDVETAVGVWGIRENGSYYFDYIIGDGNTNKQLTKRHYINIHYDNTFSVEVEGDDRNISHYKKIESTIYSELTTHNMN